MVMTSDEPCGIPARLCSRSSCLGCILNIWSYVPGLLQDLIFYFKYASSAYTPICPRPNGQTFVAEVRGFALPSQLAL